MRFAAGLLIFLSPVSLFSYIYPLSPTAIREAYFLGQRTDDKKLQFFEAYRRYLPMPKSGPHIAAISVLTPYEQIVERAGTYKNYSAQDAAQDFTNQPGEIRVRIEIRLTPTYSQLVGTESGVPVPRGEDFWNDFEFRLRQNEKILSRLQTESEAVYAGNSAGIIGANVFMRYKCEDVAALPVTVQVLTPDGQRVEAVFDLATLR